MRGGCRCRRSRGPELTGRAAAAIRWLPPLAALAYVFVLLRRLPEIVGQLTWNADYVSVMVIAQSVGTYGKSGRAVIVQSGWAWYDLATLHAPFHREVWEYTPFAMAIVSLALIAWTAWRLAGPFAGLLTASIAIAGSPLVIATELAQSYHGTTWLGAAVLAAYLCRVVIRPMRRLTAIALGAVVAMVVGFATATDPLLIAAGDVPFVLALVALWLWRRDAMPRGAAITAAGIAIVTGAAVLANRFAGVGSSFPRGLTHLVPANHLA